MKANTDGLTMNQLAERNAEHVATIATLEARCAALAAEGAKLKNPDNWLSQSDYGYEAAEVAAQNGATDDESLRAGMIAIINLIQTPATDDFLAEVRVQALEQFAVQQESISEKYPAGSYGQESVYDAAQCAREFAGQLRQEAAQ